MLSITCLVEPGARKPENDDRAVVNGVMIAEGMYSEEAKGPSLLVLCDGVGGEAYGYKAAEIAAGCFSWSSDMILSRGAIEALAASANHAIREARGQGRPFARMATTIAGLYIHDKDYVAFNAGDTRVLRFRAPYLYQISTDHTVWQEQVRAGGALRQGQENMLTRYLGGEYVQPDIVEGVGQVFPQDMYILCTDGVWHWLKDEEIERVLSDGQTLEGKCRTLVDAAMKNGSTDNLSVIIARRG